MIGRIIWRDIRRSYALGGRSDGQGGAILPILFFLTVIILYPFAVGPDLPLLQKTGSGIIWVAALLAAILPIDRLVAPDMRDGRFDQYALRGLSEELVVLGKIIAHWAGFAPPLLLASMMGCVLMGLEQAAVVTLLLGVLIATPALAALGIMIAAIMAGLNAGMALAGLLFLPLAIPLLIFGAGSNLPGGENGLLLLAATALVLFAMAPFAAAAAIRAGRS